MTHLSTHQGTPGMCLNFEISELIYSAMYSSEREKKDDPTASHYNIRFSESVSLALYSIARHFTVAFFCAKTKLQAVPCQWYTKWTPRFTKNCRRCPEISNAVRNNCRLVAMGLFLVMLLSVETTSRTPRNKHTSLTHDVLLVLAVDCGEGRPDWGSPKLGILFCFKCSGIHRCV